MARFENGVHPVFVSMLPDGTEIWERNFLPSLDAVLYKSPGCEDSIVRALLYNAYAAESDQREVGMPRINRGFQGNIYGFGDDAVIKIAHDPSAPVHPYCLNDIVANLALSIGFQRTKEDRDDLPFVLSAPRIYAAVVPRDTTDAQIRVSSAMERVVGRNPREWKIPSTVVRASWYIQAINACGMNMDSVVFDHQTDDILIRRFLLGSRVKELSILDICGRGDLTPAEIKR